MPADVGLHLAAVVAEHVLLVRCPGLGLVADVALVAHEHAFAPAGFVVEERESPRDHCEVGPASWYSANLSMEIRISPT